ncbi:PIR protein [Plasmodium ovale]|uniref:PIR protein n=1 Tax=Plasmodium ovale TaxID=36330 RepID=A0A1D3JC51_PLAOA|nr:PIR protein [Plasmodium ovale]
MNINKNKILCCCLTININTHKLIDNNFPASNFDKEFRKDIKYDQLVDYVLGIEDTIDLSKWYENFKLCFHSYFYVKSKEWESREKLKRCRDFNYYMDCVLDLVLEIEKKKKFNQEIINNIRNFIDETFVDNTHFQCNRKKNIYTHDMHTRKKLDDFCENRDYLINIRKNSDEQCNILDKYVYDKYNCLISYESCMNNSKTKNDNPLHISDDCTFYDIRRTFPYYKCNDGDTSYHNYRISEVPFCHIHVISDEEESFEIEHLNENKSKKITTGDILFYGGFILIGTFLLFSFSYKFTPLGNWIRKNITKIYNKSKYTEETTENLLENQSNYMDINVETKPHNMSYHPL